MVEKVSDFMMPEKIVTRLLKDALPENVMISKDAKNAACRSASIFILQLSIAAAERAQMNNRRTLENQDIIKAVTELGLGEYAPQLVRFGAQRKRNARRKEATSIQKNKSNKKISPEELHPEDSYQDYGGVVAPHLGGNIDVPDKSFNVGQLENKSHEGDLDEDEEEGDLLQIEE